MEPSLHCRSFFQSVTFFGVCAVCNSAPLQAQETDLAARIRKLEQRLATWETQRAETSSAWLKRGPFELHMGGFVQADAVAYRQDSEDQLDGSTGQPLNETRFVIRRARLRAEAVSRYLGAALEVDGNTTHGTQVRLLGGEVFAQWPTRTGDIPYARATLGLFKIPFGHEVRQYDPERHFLERSQVIRALFPGEYDLGIAVQGGFHFFRYALSVMNGEPSGEEQFAARDPNQSKDFLGRLGIDLTFARLFRFRAGFSGLYGQGFSPGQSAGKDVLSWRDDNDDGQVQLSEILVVRGQAAVPSQNFMRDAIGVDAEIAVWVPTLGTLEFSGELLVARNLDRGIYPADPIATGRDLREFGYYALVTQEITPYVRMGVRFDFYDPDSDRQQQLGVLRLPISTAFSTLTATVAVQLPRYGRVALEYQNQRNALGRTAAGIPTTLGKDSVVLRAQVSF